MVYEGNAAVGSYQLVSASNVTPAGPGEGWYSSGRINIPLTNGRYYLFVASFVGTATYYNQQNITPYPIPASFGELIGGVGWTWAPPVLFPPSGFMDVPDYAYGDHVAYYQTLVTQAGPLWLAVNPEEGSIPTGGGVDLSVGFDARAMNDGDYTADLVLETNDPDEAEVKVPLRFRVTGTPDIEVTPASLDFDSLFVGGWKVLDALIKNVGTDSLLIQSIQPSLPIWTVDDMPALLLPGESTFVSIRFAPTAVGAVSGTLEIVTNDPDEPSVSLVLSGVGKSAPVIQLSPTQISQTVYAGEVQIVPLRVHNSGGSPLEFTVGFQFPVPPFSDWLFVEPPFGTVPAGGDLDLNVILDSRNVSPGPYAGILDFDSNDPLHAFVQISVQMNHVSAPNLVLSLPELQFGTVYVGYPKSLSLVARNTGNTPLAVSDINSDEPDFGSATGPFVLEPAESTDVVASFDPSSFGEKVGHLTFASDDPRPATPLLLHGAGAAAPHVTAAPETLVAALPPAGKATRTISLCNTAGSDLTYGVHTHPEQFVGPDAAGNVGVQSDDPLGPVFSWIEIEQSGTPVFPSQADDENAGKFPIGFPFPYYGAVFESLRVCSNGWISFTSSAVEFADHTLPSANSGTPRNLVAALWDDWVVDPAQGGNVYVHGTPERAVIEFRNVRRFENAGGQASSFEIVLYPTGHIRFQYLTACAPGGTAGIQNATGTQGLTVFSETRAIPAGHAVAVGPFLGHLTAMTQSG
ncbi:MAG TPA: choice-of-anchor D domain-containing protein, partial [Candidatus Eisenbacteria bacterium]|nr:choice-of-anchor D domain-containing protein [Candidatus Eisenbacteria bacterium]